MPAQTSQEQLLLELINRARLDPAGEAARYGIDLNQGLSAGTISATAKQVLASNSLLALSADGHSAWMLANNTFSHTGNGGSSALQRIQASGYSLTTPWSVGENIAWIGNTVALDMTQAVLDQHEGLFLSAGHRTNILNASYREVGLGVETGSYTHTDNVTYTASVMTTENFAVSGASIFLTGVAYNDTDNDNFYSVGEGRGGVTVTVGSSGGTAATATPGGYERTVAQGASTVTFSGGGLTQAVTVSVVFGTQNAKLDLVDGNSVASSIDLTLGTNAVGARLLGVSDLYLIGNNLPNFLDGNAGANTIYGGIGADTIYGGGGNDHLLGEAGNDYLYGGAGNDLLDPGPGDNFVFGGAGYDTAFLSGSRGDYHITRGSNGSYAVTGAAGFTIFNETEYFDFSQGADFAARDLVDASRAGFDVNADGLNDILLQNNRAVAVWSMTDHGPKSGHMIGGLGAGWEAAGAGDFNGDGRSDVLLQNGQQLAFWILDEDKVSGGGNLGTLGSNWHVAGIGDFDGNQQSDIVLQNDNGMIAIWKMNGATIAGGNIASLGQNWSVKDTGDFNNDGRSEFLLFNQSTEEMAIWWLSDDGASWAGGKSIGQLAAGWSPLKVGDFNGDGTDDLLLNKGQSLGLWEVNNRAVSQGSYLGDLATGWKVGSVGDLSGDGNADLLLERNGDLAVWRMDGFTVDNAGIVPARLDHGWLIES